MSVLQEIKVLKEIANDDHATVVMTYFKNKDKIKEGDALIELETTKTTFVVNAEKEGYVEYLCKDGDEVAVASTIIYIHDDPADIKSAEEKTVFLKDKSIETKFSAAASELIKNERLDVSLFAGQDFVSAEDVHKFLKSSKDLGHGPKESFEGGPFKLQKISKAKMIEIESLAAVQSANMNSMVSVFVDMDNVAGFARDHLDILKGSILPFIIFEVSRLLKKYPEFNAFFASDSIAFYNDVNIGLAINLGHGLKVAKSVGTDSKSIKQIEAEIVDMANKYLDKKLTGEDISGSTFTVTDLSQTGVHFFVPLINKQQSAVLGICAVDKKLNRCALTLSFDHRVSEGKKAGEFLNELKTRIENYVDPMRSKGKDVPVHAGARCYKCLATLEDIKHTKGAGLFHVIDCKGQEQYVCELCLEGWT